MTTRHWCVRHSVALGLCLVLAACGRTERTRPDTTATVLETLAANVANGRPPKPRDFDRALARAHSAEATQHLVHARAALLENDDKRAGEEFLMAVDHLERAAKDAKLRRDSVVETAVADACTLAGEMVRATAAEPDETSRGFGHDRAGGPPRRDLRVRPTRTGALDPVRVRPARVGGLRWTRWRSAPNVMRRPHLRVRHDSSPGGAMPAIRTLRALTTAAAIVVCGCHGNRSAMRTEPNVSLIVRNDGLFDVTIYALPSAGASTRIRLGSVSGVSSTTLSVPARNLQQGRVMQLLLHGLGARSSWVSPAVTLPEGTQAHLDIYASPSGDLSRSSFYVLTDGP